MNPYPAAIPFTAFNLPALPAAPRGPIELHVARAAGGTATLSSIAEQVCGAGGIKLRSETSHRESAQSYVSAAPPHADIAPADAARYCFAPGVEEVWIDWTHTGPEFIGESRLELFCTIGGASQLVWRKVFRWDVCPAQARTRFDGELAILDEAADIAANTGLRGVILDVPGDPALFPADHVTIEHSPYQLKLTVVPRAGGITVTSRSAWTYFDIRPGGITLSFCPNADLPSILPRTNQGMHVAVCRRLADDQDADNLNGAIPTRGQTKKVYLKSNIFYRSAPELADLTYFNRYRDLWGDGPVIPILATIQLRDSAGNAVDAPCGVGTVKLMWDWVDQGALPWPINDSNIEAWMNDAREYKTAGTPDSPQGKNCHVDRGGKRGIGAKTCFPAQTGKAPARALPRHDDSDDMFPFEVTPLNAAGSPFAGRKWAAYSKSWPTGTLGGKSGVLFQPSRMVGDGYDLHVYLAYDTDHEMETSAAPRTVAAELHAETGTFQIWKEVDILKHWVMRGDPDRPAEPAMNLAPVKDKFARYYVNLNLPAAPELSLDAWRAGLARVAPTRPGNANYAWDALYAAQNGPQLIRFTQFDAWYEKMLAAHGGDVAALRAWSRGLNNGLDAYGNPRMHLWEDLFGGNGKKPIRTPWPLAFEADGVLEEKGQILMEFPDLPGDNQRYEVTFDYAAGMNPMRNRVATLTKRQREDLKSALKNRIAVHTSRLFGDDEQMPFGESAVAGRDAPLRVKVSGRQDSADRRARITYIRELLVALSEEISGTEARDNYVNAKVGRGWAFFVFDAVLESILDTEFGQQGGIVVTQLTGLANFDTVNGKAFFANAAGTRAVAATLVPTPAQATLEHEIGHALFLNHRWQERGGGEDLLRLHQLGGASSGRAGNCIMHFAVSQNTTPENLYCAFCIARVWGWSFVNIDPATSQPVAPPKRTLFPDRQYNTLALGDPPANAPDPVAAASPHPVM